MFKKVKRILMFLSIIFILLPNINLVYAAPLDSICCNDYYTTMPDRDDLIENILSSYNNKFQMILDEPDKYEIQILYTQINRLESGDIYFDSFTYNIDNKRYFYPASSIKIAACALSLEKLNILNIDGLNKNTRFTVKMNQPKQTDKQNSKQINNKTIQIKKTTYSSTISQCIKNILLRSDNNSFNMLFEFLGRDYFNEALASKGFTNTTILNMMYCNTYHSSNYNNSITFYDNNNNIIYHQNKKNNSRTIYNNLKPIYKGIGYYRNNEYINKPRNFSYSNHTSVEDLQNIIKAIIFPKCIPDKNKFNINEEDYKFLKKYMCILPRECNPKINLSDSYVKYFMVGGSNEKLQSNIKIYNKIGNSYGFLIDNAYIQDIDNNIDYLLTAVIYTNENEILNDGKYEYNKIGFPFLKNLGQVIYEFEKNNRKL